MIWPALGSSGATTTKTSVWQQAWLVSTRVVHSQVQRRSKGWGPGWSLLGTYVEPWTSYRALSGPGWCELTPRCGRKRWGRRTPPWCPWCSRNLSCKLQGARWTLDRESAMISQVTDWQPRPNHTSISYGEVNMQQSGTGRAQIYRWKERETIRSRQCWRWQRADQDQDILHWSPLDVEPSGQMRLCKFLIIKATS